MIQRISALLFLAASAYAQTSGSVSIVSGNGQVVGEQFPTTVPMVIQAKDVNGRPIANLPVTWTLRDPIGSILGADTVTNANGQAVASFIGTNLQLGYSFIQTKINASTSVGNVDFWITVSIFKSPNGGLVAMPLVELLSPGIGARTISGRAGSTVPGAIAVRVTAQSGTQAGQPVPNVGVRIENQGDPSVTPSATCAGPAGIVLTNSEGLATCDAVLNQVTGTSRITASVGEYQNTPEIALQITPGVACTFALNPSSQVAAAAAGTGSVSVLAAAGCAWTATSNATWLTINGPSSGSGNGTLNFSIAANTGAARTGTLTVAGQTFTVTQNAAQTVLGITTPASLPSATVNTSYSQTFAAAGGRAPYAFSVSGSLPPGLVFTSPTLSGVPTTAGTYTFTLTATDANNTSVAQTETLVVVTAGSGPTITTASLPNGVINTPYSQVIAVAGGCVSPFSPQPTLSLASGSLPPGLAINGLTIAGTPTTNGTYAFTLKAADSCGRSSTANLTIVVGSSTPVAQLSASPQTISFSYQQGSGVAPAAVPVSVQSNGAALAFQATTNGTAWLTLDKNSATTPATISVGLTNLGSMPAGSYSGSVTIAAQGSTVSIPVALNITAAPSLTISPTAIAVTQTASATAKSVQQPISILSTGAPVSFTASATSTGNWLQVSAATGQTPGTVNAILNYGGLATGTYTGSITIVPAGSPSQTIAVSLTIIAPPTISISPDSLTFQAQQGGGAPNQQTVRVSATGTAAAYIVSTNADWLSALRTPASDQLTVSVNPGSLQAGTYKGNIQLISADPAVSPVSIPVTFTVSAPTPSISAISNAASFARGGVSPGEIVTLFGSTMGPATLVASRITSAGALDSTLGGTRVLFDGVPAPLVYSVSGQVSAIVPYSVAGRSSTSLQVEWNGIKSAAQDVPVVASAPAIFVTDNQGQGAIVNPDGTINLPATPTTAGSVVSIYATGEGEVNPSLPDGQIVGDTLPRPKLPVTVTIGGQNAEVLYAGGSPGQAVGLLQVNVRIPDGLTGRQPVVLKVGDNSSPDGVFISLK